MTNTVQELVLAILVSGVPVPQGSKTAWGSEANPHVRSWRQAIAEEAGRLIREPVRGAVEVDCEFVFPRPKSHYRTGKYAGWLRDSAPRWHSSAPDLDKLQRAVGDALTHVVLRDDGQIARWTCSKRYGEMPCARITVSWLRERDDE